MSRPTKAAWHEYALLQVLQDKPVIPWEQWRRETPLHALLRTRFPDLSHEEVEEWINTS